MSDDKAEDRVIGEEAETHTLVGDLVGDGGYEVEAPEDSSGASKAAGDGARKPPTTEDEGPAEDLAPGEEHLADEDETPETAPEEPAEEPGEESDESQQEGAAEPPDLPPRLLQAARRSKVSDAAVAALGDEAVPFLTNVADTYDRISSDLSQLGRARGQEGGIAPPPQAAPVQPPPQGPAPSEPFRLKLDPDVLGEEQVEALQGPIETVLNSLRTELAAVQQSVQERQVAELDARFDTFFDGAGDVYGDLLGKGRTSSLAQGSTERKLREQIKAEAVPIALGLSALGRPDPIAEAADRAASFVLKDVQIEAARIGQTKARQSRRAGSSRRPTQRRSKQTFRNATERAEAGYAKTLREQGREVPKE